MLQCFKLEDFNSRDVLSTKNIRHYRRPIFKRILSCLNGRTSYRVKMRYDSLLL